MSFGSKPFGITSLGGFQRGVLYTVQTALNGSWSAGEGVVTSLGGSWQSSEYLQVDFNGSWGSAEQVLTVLTPTLTVESYIVTSLNSNWGNLDGTVDPVIPKVNAYCVQPVERTAVVRHTNANNCKCDEEQ